MYVMKIHDKAIESVNWTNEIAVHLVNSDYDMDHESFILFILTRFWDELLPITLPKNKASSPEELIISFADCT